MDTELLKKQTKDKRVLYVSTKNADYIRNVQEINLIQSNSRACRTIVYGNKNYLVRILKVYVKLLLEIIRGNFDVLFIGFAPQFLFLLFPFISRKKTLVIDFFISFYDTLVDDRKKIKENHIMAKIVHRIDGYVLERADYAVSDTIAHRQYFIEEFQVSQHKFITLYLEADVLIYDKKEQEKPVELKDKFVVMYFGSILPLQGIEVIMEAMTLLKEESNIHFIIVGPLEKKFDISSGNYPNTDFIEWLKQEELAKKINSADLCLAGHFNGEIGKADRTIAGKSYIYKAMNKPVVLGKSKANYERYKEDNIMNYYVERGNPKDLARCIRTVYVKWKTNQDISAI